MPQIFSFGLHERNKWVAEQAAAVLPGSKVLDVGAGTCRYKPLFSHCEYESQDFVQYEGSNMGTLGNDFDTWHYGSIDYVCDATDIPAADDSFDVILCTEVLEHVPEPIKVLAECARLLRTGGKLLVTAPLSSGLHQEPYHYYGGYTPYWYQTFLTRYGFEQICTIANGGFFRHYGQESQRFSALIDPRRLKGYWKAILLPFWIYTLPFFRIFLPLLCSVFDKTDVHRGFTVGYHVTAVKQ